MHSRFEASSPSSRMIRRLLALGLGLAALAAAPAWAEDLKLTGAQGQAAVLTPADIAALPHVTLNVQIGGQAHIYQGVSLVEILRGVGAPYGVLMHGKAVSEAVIVTGRDGYTVVLSLAETDPGMRKETVILADSLDGKPLPDNLGPYRLVVDGDAHPSRSARMVTGIEVRSLAPPPPSSPPAKP